MEILRSVDYLFKAFFLKSISILHQSDSSDGWWNITGYFSGCKNSQFGIENIYFYQIPTTFNKLKIISEVAHENGLKVKTIYRFRKLVLDWDSSLECFNWATHDYGLFQLVPVRYRKRQNDSLLSLTGKDNERWWMQVVIVSRVAFYVSNGCIFACYFICLK